MEKGGFQIELGRISFADAIDRVKSALAQNGFGVITEIDLQKKFREKLSVDFRRYSILGACNPALAYEALKLDPTTGLLLPCNVVVEENSAGTVVVSIVDPKLMLGAASPTVAPIAEEAGRRLAQVAADLGSR